MSIQSASDIKTPEGFNAKKPFYFAVVLAISLAATWLCYASGVIRYWDKVLYDHCINYRVRHGAKNPQIAPIYLDDASITELWEGIDNRQAFADLLEVLNDFGAAPVMDFIFQVKKNEDIDTEFAGALKESENAVIAVLAVGKEMENKPELEGPALNALARHIWRINVLKDGKVPEAESFFLSFPELVEAAGQVGFINMEPDSDGIYRRVPLLYKWKDGYIPSLPLAAAAKHLRVPIDKIELKAGAYLALA